MFDNTDSFELTDPSGGFVSLVDCDDWEPGLGWHVALIKVPLEARGQGVAQRLMDEVLAGADARGITLTLEVSPQDDYTSRDKLVAWYSSLGFVESGNIMRRPAYALQGR